MDGNGATGSNRWEGKRRVELKRVPVEKAWSAVADFGNIHKWFPNVEVCELVSGEQGKPGLTRYCASTTKSGDGSSENATSWAIERLLTIEPIERCLSYDILDNNIGFGYYVAHIKVLPAKPEGGGAAVGCVIDWTFQADPVVGWRAEDLDNYIGFCLAYMADKIDAFFPEQ